MSKTQSSLPRFDLSHPKNYFGVPIAVAADGDTGGLIMQHITNSRMGQVERGAKQLGLITDTNELTSQGREVVSFAEREYGSVDEALDVVDSWYRKQTRFIDMSGGAWASIAAKTMREYTPAARVIDVLGDFSNDATLPDFISHAAQNGSEDVCEMFLSGDALVGTNQNLHDLTAHSEILYDAESYRSTAICQFKSILFHTGILTQVGVDSGTLEPTLDTWALDYESGCVPPRVKESDSMTLSPSDLMIGGEL